MAVREPIRAPELSELETFVLAVEEGSIARAAGRLPISPQAAAKRIRQLEVLAHNALLIRSPRGVNATEAGATLYAAARELLAHRSNVMAALGSAPPPDPQRIAGMHHLLARPPAPAPEQLLRETEAVLAAIFHATEEAVLMTRVEDGLIHELNDAAEGLLGYARDELRGRTALDVDLWEDARRRDECVQLAVSTRTPQKAELVLRTRAGDRRVVAARFEAIELHNTVHVLVMLRDVPNRSAAGRTTNRRRFNGRADEELAARFFEALR